MVISVSSIVITYSQMLLKSAVWFIAGTSSDAGWSSYYWDSLFIPSHWPEMVGEFLVCFVQNDETISVVRKSDAIDKNDEQQTKWLTQNVTEHGADDRAGSCHEDEKQSDKDYRSVHRVLPLSWRVIGDGLNIAVLEQEDEHGVHDEQEGEGKVGVETRMNLKCGQKGQDIKPVARFEVS